MKRDNICWNICWIILFEHARWLQYDLLAPIWSLHKKPDSYSPKSLYRHHGVGIYDNSKQEECSPLVPASRAYSKSVHRVCIALFVEYPWCFFLCHNLRLHKLKNRGIAYVKRSSFCFRCSISMPYLLIKTPSPLWDQEILTYIRKCLGSVPAWAVVYKCPVCVDLLLVGRRSERLCRRLVTV